MTTTTRRWIYALTALALLAWTGAAWGIHALLGASGELMAGQLPALALDAELRAWLAAAGGVLLAGGGVVLWALWGLGAVTIIAFGWLAPRLIDGLAARLKGFVDNNRHHLESRS